MAGRQVPKKSIHMNKFLITKSTHKPDAFRSEIKVLITTEHTKNLTLLYQKITETDNYCTRPL